MTTRIGVKIDGVVEGPTLEGFLADFIDWIESKGWHFGGGVSPCPLDEDEGKGVVL